MYEDGLIMSESEEVLEKVLTEMTEEFEIKSHESKYFVELEIGRNRKKITEDSSDSLH